MSNGYLYRTRRCKLFSSLRLVITMHQVIRSSNILRTSYGIAFTYVT